MREEEEIKGDRMQFVSDLKDCIDKRLLNLESDETLKVLEIFDAQSLVILHCGKLSNKKPLFDIEEGE